MNSLKQVKILYLEDDEIVRDSAIKFFNAIFEQVHIAKDGEEAISMLEDIEVLDLLLTDVNMPGIDGIDTAVVFKKKFPDLKVIFLTAYQNDELSNQIREKIKPNEILSKPIRLNKLVEIISKIILDGDNK